jgi:hypothetical protein
VRVVWEILREVRLLFSSVGRGWEAGAGVNDVLAHAPQPLDTPMRISGILTARADVVELVDTLDSGSSGRKPVGVRVSPSAPYGGVAQLVRATGSYPVGRRFESARRYQPEFEFKSALYTPFARATNRRDRWV